MILTQLTAGLLVFFAIALLTYTIIMLTELVHDVREYSRGSYWRPDWQEWFFAVAELLAVATMCVAAWLLLAGA